MIAANVVSQCSFPQVLYCKVTDADFARSGKTKTIVLLSFASTDGAIPTALPQYWTAALPAARMTFPIFARNFFNRMKRCFRFANALMRTLLCPLCPTCTCNVLEPNHEH